MDCIPETNIIFFFKSEFQSQLHLFTHHVVGQVLNFTAPRFCLLQNSNNPQGFVSIKKKCLWNAQSTKRVHN